MQGFLTYIQPGDFNYEIILYSPGMIHHTRRRIDSSSNTVLIVANNFSFFLTRFKSRVHVKGIIIVNIGCFAWPNYLKKQIFYCEPIFLKN